MQQLSEFIFYLHVYGFVVLIDVLVLMWLVYVGSVFLTFVKRYNRNHRVFISTPDGPDETNFFYNLVKKLHDKKENN